MAAAALDHRRHDGPHRVQRAEVVDVHLLAEDGVVEPLEVPRMGGAGGGDEHVARPVGLGGRGQRRRQRVGVGDVGRCGDRRTDVGRGGGRPTGVARAMSDTRAPRRDGQAGGLQADPTRAPGDHDVCIGELGHAPIVPRNPRLASHRVPPARARHLLRRGGGRRSPRPSRRPPPARRADFTVQPSVEQVAVTGATAGATAVLRAADGRKVASRPIDAAGSALFRDVGPGAGYVVSVGNARAAPVTVTSPTDTPPQSLYTGQHLGPGYGYLTTRDGTMLSVNVTLPGPASGGPYPTVVEYSGYDPSNPDATQPASRIAQLLGFATVGVNLRGTGCSGGAYDYFEELQSLDGYDVVETIAAQPWVLHGTVGMVGISFPGITQLFVAHTRPPHLAAITPLSVLDDTYATLYPGGIFNNGFALGWAKDRQADARPSTSSGGGQGWASKRIAAGDETCRANQALRLQAPGVLREIRANAYRRGAATDALAPASFVHDIDVPVFLAGAWQDQETGSHFANMISNFSPDIPMKVTLMNGVHQDSLAPAVLSEWIEFLDFYVAKTDPVGPTGRPRAGHDRPVPSVRAGRVAGTRPLHERARLRVGVACLRSRAEGAGAVRRRGRERRVARVLGDRAVVPAAAHHREDVVPGQRRRAHRFGTRRRRPRTGSRTTRRHFRAR